MSSNAMFLDIDPSIMEANMTITKENPIEEELKNLFTSSSTPSKLVKPLPGFCVKTYSKDKKKIFINVCQTDALPSPPDISSSDLMKVLNSEEQSSYRVPMSIGEGRKENDKSGVPATVYDVAINSSFFKKVEKEELFQTFFLTIVFEGLKDKYQVNIDFENEKYTILKNRKTMGILQSHRIQNRDVKRVERSLKNPLIEEITSQATACEKEKMLRADDVKEIKYRILKSETGGKYLMAEFKIPNHISLEELNLEVGEDRVVLDWIKNSTVDFYLPCSVDQNYVEAELNRNIQVLSVKLPLKNP